MHSVNAENYLITGVCAHIHIHTSTYRVNNSVAHHRMIGLCMYIIFTTIPLKYFSTNSVAMMKYLAGVMPFGIHHWSSSYQCYRVHHQCDSFERMCNIQPEQSHLNINMWYLLVLIMQWFQFHTANIHNSDSKQQ